MNKYGLLTFIEESGKTKHGKVLWRLRCDCGQTTVAVASQVRSGKTKSCGHLKRAGNRRTHGKRHSKLYTAWCNMKSRCDNQSHKYYRNYGGRGITYNPAWSNFEVFAADVGEPPSELHTLDRIDNHGNYTKDNVRWAIRAVQSRNTRVNVWVEIDGETKCLHDWCEIYGIAAASVYRRLYRGLDMVTAITMPKAKRFR